MRGIMKHCLLAMTWLCQMLQELQAAAATSTRNKASKHKASEWEEDYWGGVSRSEGAEVVGAGTSTVHCYYV